MPIQAELLQPILREDLVNAGWSGYDSFPGQSSRDFAMATLNRTLLKKFHEDKTDEHRDAAALALFLECNSRCAEFGHIVPRSTFEEYVLGEMKTLIYDFFNPPVSDVFVTRVDDFVLYRDREPHLLNLSDIANRFGFGSGSNIGASSTDFYSKYFCSDMTTTDLSLPVLYRHAITSDRLLCEAEKSRTPSQKTRLVSGNRLSFVPKSTSISRTICTEPLVNMLFQKGIGKLLEERLLEVWNIDLSKQPERNAAMARIGSLNGRFGTIDLSSASDTISIGLVKQLFELAPEPLGWLIKTRSPATVLPDGTTVELSMISSMGNAFTFPLQTLIFSALVAAVYKILDIPVLVNGDRRNFSVFGDDIIVESVAYNRVIDMLELLGFLPNRSKSFNEGLFRESCGHDYYQGCNVRGVYLTRLNTPGDFYSAINRLNRWSASHEVPLPLLVGYLVKHSAIQKLYVPFDEADDAGIKVPYGYAGARSDRNGSAIYRALVTLPNYATIPEERQYEERPSHWLRLIRKKLKRFEYNESGLLYALIAGWLRSGRLGLRSCGRPKTVLKRRTCPCWDGPISNTAQPDMVAFGVKWKYHTALNLSVLWMVEDSWR